MGTGHVCQAQRSAVHAEGDTSNAVSFWAAGGVLKGALLLVHGIVCTVMLTCFQGCLCTVHDQTQQSLVHWVFELQALLHACICGVSVLQPLAIPPLCILLGVNAASRHPFELRQGFRDWPMPGRTCNGIWQGNAWCSPTAPAQQIHSVSALQHQRMLPIAGRHLQALYWHIDPRNLGRALSVDCL